MVLTFKSLHSNGPAYVQDILNWYAPTRDLRSMNCLTLVPMKCRSIMVHNKLLQNGSSKRWNDLPKSVKCAGSLTLFKKNVKKLLFQSAIITLPVLNILSMYKFCMYPLSNLLIECNH